tara:strand:+ start:5780 stop:7714 length:1935 start_codon:yes stop_codon:yes gene_type:complete
MVVDLLVLTFAFALAFLIRFDWRPPADMVGRIFLVLPYAVLFEYVVLRMLGVHRFSWRYVGLRESVRILIAAGLWSVGLVIARLFFGELQGQYPFFRHGVVPLGALAMNFVLSFLGITGVRAARRVLGERRDASETMRSNSIAPRSRTRVRTMLVGAGQAGFMVARELGARPELGLEAVGFIDDDETKVGSVIHGVPVLGRTTDLARLCQEHDASDVLITMANVPGSAIRRIRRLCEEAGITPKIIPGLYEIVGGDLNLTRIRDVALEDLLRREPVQLDEASIAEYISGRTALVTGAGGSIGSELCRQVARFAPRQLVLVEQAENALFEIHRELRALAPDVEIVPCIADVTDVERIDGVFTRFRPDAVFHAAAHKHVPMMEANPGEAIKNNVFGSKNVADAAHRHGCDVLVMVSTDKAVNPTSIMGATKRVAELYVQSVAARSETRFVTVRFGNVLGSNGSVVPIFKQQISRGGPVTVTHPDMQRYFMTIPEASQLILQAGSLGTSGDIMVLDMGEPVKIVDLARDLISLSGVGGEGVEIEFTGVRPGEKLFEELATDAEHAEKTRHPKIFVGRTPRLDLDRVRRGVEHLERVSTADRNSVRDALRELVPEMQQPADEPTEAKPATKARLFVARATHGPAAEPA